MSKFNHATEEKIELKVVPNLVKVGKGKLFTPEECTEIINTASKWEEEKALVGNPAKTDGSGEWIENFDIRNATIFRPKKPEKFFDKIFVNISHFNKGDDGWHFDISTMIEPPRLMKYSAPDVNPNGKPGKYDWHLDIGGDPTSALRKLSYSILLNAGEYEGGELEFGNTDPEGKFKEIQNSSEYLGQIIVFPSFLSHRVLKMTKGVRYSLVGWIHGNSFT